MRTEEREELTRFVRAGIVAIRGDECAILDATIKVDWPQFIGDAMDGFDPAKHLAEPQATGKIEILPVVSAVCSVLSTVIAMAQLYLKLRDDAARKNQVEERGQELGSTFTKEEINALLRAFREQAGI